MMLSNDATRRRHHDGGAQVKRRMKDEEVGRDVSNPWGPLAF